jgi:hypothetical protein
LRFKEVDAKVADDLGKTAVRELIMGPVSRGVELSGL